MKHINFSLWWWFVYQWWIWAFIKYSIDTYNDIDNDYTKTYSKDIKEILDSAFVNSSDFFWILNDENNIENIDILLEWKWNCFEDINLLYKNWNNKTQILFFQVKWWNEILLKDWKKRKKWILSNKKDRIHLFSNFLNNKNIYNISHKSKFILISNIHFDNNILNIVKWIDITLITNKIISEVRSKFKYKIKVKSECLNKLDRLINDIYNWVKVKRRMFWVTLPFRNQEEQDEIILFIQNTIEIIKRTIILEDFNLSTIKNKLYKELWEEGANKLFQKIYYKSINISTIKNIDADFTKYLKYNDIFFIENKKINDIEELREWKFL